jgi:hypothetical protein
MAVGDLTAEQQAYVALTYARDVLEQLWDSKQCREHALGEIREALKRIEEAGCA